MGDIAFLPNPRLDVRDLRVVLALASAGTTAQAATVLHLTQPAVSRALLAAEDKLGARLFDRTPKGLVLTEAGQELVSGATRLLVDLGDLEHRVRAPVAKPMRIRLVCECYTAYHWLPSALVNLRKSLPGLELSLAVEHTKAPVPALVAGDIDVALVTSSPVPHAQLEERHIFTDEVLFIMSSSHPLASRKALTRDDLRETTLLTGQTPPAEAQWFMKQVFGRERPRLRFEQLPLTEALVDVARAGMGVAVLSEWIARPHLDKGGLVAKRFASGPLRRSWRIAWRREVGDAALRLAAALETTAPRNLSLD
ncbi:LysR family transcriptional regulator [Pyxidicoccus fallax]|uniref:LysR family transcriptional regulator n=1 Tax=Pyxidicoccus fallax TaxID=394095 RepID=A0A848LC25_9BACT|nr:LysR family transcriptional regulator [Pyxidicoccus fallax]NMO14375.1 LysR family transcriptional regulator [Pyxidicoccus fallax]NPC86937.1 LysR family transcriptional regulator [Pyxidicoccus fallax]